MNNSELDHQVIYESSRLRCLVKQMQLKREKIGGVFSDLKSFNCQKKNKKGERTQTEEKREKVGI